MITTGKILVSLHIYYQEQIPYFLDKLKNIHDCEWDLVVSYSEIKKENMKFIEDFKPGTRFIEAENTGYDIWPFIKVIKSINPDDYKYVIKLHTKNCDFMKNRINGISLRGESWRDMLVDAILKDGRQFEKAIGILEKDNMAGMVCNAALIKNIAGFRPWAIGVVPDEMDRIGLDIRLRDKNMVFCAGTMFLARIKPFTFLKEAEITPETFSDTGGSHLNNKMAHCYERMLGFAVLADNYAIRGLWTDSSDKTIKIAHDVYSPILKWIFSIDYSSRGEKCLTILGIKIPLRKFVKD